MVLKNWNDKCVNKYNKMSFIGLVRAILLFFIFSNLIVFHVFANEQICQNYLRREATNHNDDFSLITRSIDLRLRNEISETQSLGSFFRSIRNGFDRVRYQSHIIRNTPKVRVRNQCFGECTLASIGANYESYLKRVGILEDEGTMLELSYLAAALQNRHNNQEFYLTHINGIFSGFSFEEGLMYLKDVEPWILTAEQVKSLGGQSRVTELERGFKKYLVQLGRQHKWEFIEIVTRPLDKFLDGIEELWFDYVEKHTGLRLKSKKITSIFQNLKTRLKILNYLTIRDINNIHTLSYKGVLHQTLIDLESYKDNMVVSRLFSGVLDPKDELPNDQNSWIIDNASFDEDFIRPIIDEIIKGRPISINLLWTKEKGFHAEQHAVLLTGVVINPQTQIFEGFIYQNSWSKKYGFLGESFLSRKDFEDSYGTISTGVVFY